MPHAWQASVCGSAAGVALRLRFAMRSSAPALLFPRSPTADRSQEVRNRSPLDEIATRRFTNLGFINQ